MKYGLLAMDHPRSMYNIGDAMQILAIRNLYRYMRIPIEEIIVIHVSELNTYQGELIILPINFPMYGYYDLSKDIVPVYLGISVMSNTVAKGLRLKSREPIGCRDIHSFKELQRTGINCYYAGCMTLTLPHKDSVIIGNKVLFVDVPDSIKVYIPKEYSMCCEFSSHIVYETSHPEEIAKERYQYYCNNAKLIITSRLHCALPAIAAGIPTIFVCDHISFRYAVLASLIPIYTPDQFACIDWHPKPLECENIKQTMIDYAKMRVESEMKCVKLSKNLHQLYQKDISLYFRIPTDIVCENVTTAAFVRYLRAKYSSEKNFRYILWGGTQIAELAYQQIKKEYPEAILVEIVDEFKDIYFHNRLSVRSQVIERYPDAIVLVTAGAACIAAKNFLDQIGHKYYCICYNGLHIEDGRTISLPGQTGRLLS